MSPTCSDLIWIRHAWCLSRPVGTGRSAAGRLRFLRQESTVIRMARGEVTWLEPFHTCSPGQRSGLPCGQVVLAGGSPNGLLMSWQSTIGRIAQPHALA